MIFASVESALNYVKSRIRDFYAQSNVLKNRLIQVGALLREAKSRGAQEQIGQLIVLQSQTKDLLNEQLALEQKLVPFLSYFGFSAPALGALPVILAASAVGVAGLLYVHFEKIQNQKKALDLVAQGFLTPSEAKGILESGGILGTGGLTGLTGNLGIIAVAGLAIYGLFLFAPRQRAA